MKYFIGFILIFITGCSGIVASKADYSTENCGIAYKGECYFEKRLKIPYDDIQNPSAFIGDETCTLITPTDGCVCIGCKD